MAIFTKKQIEELFIAFARSSPYFPTHCVDIAYVLNNYFKNKNIEHEVRVYHKKFINKKINHYVIYVDGFIIDLSLCQFYLKHNLNKKQINEMSDNDLLDYFFYDHQNGKAIFKENEYHKLFTRLENDSNYSYYLINGFRRSLTPEEFVNYHFKSKELIVSNNFKKLIENIKKSNMLTI